MECCHAISVVAYKLKLRTVMNKMVLESRKYTATIIKERFYVCTIS